MLKLKILETLVYGTFRDESCMETYGLLLSMYPVFLHAVNIKNANSPLLNPISPATQKKTRKVHYHSTP